MLLDPNCDRLDTSWLNGRKAHVFKHTTKDGQSYVRKVYKLRWFSTFVREFTATTYLSKKLDFIPRILGVNFFKRTLYLSYIPGDRVLEWVIKEFGPQTVQLEQFRSFHGLGTNPIVSEALTAFKSSKKDKAETFRRALSLSYCKLNNIGWIHGSADPRNVIYDGTKVYIIDLDHARPCLQPAALEDESLDRWFGIRSLEYSRKS